MAETVCVDVQPVDGYDRMSLAGCLLRESNA